MGRYSAGGLQHHPRGAGDGLRSLPVWKPNGSRISKRTAKKLREQDFVARKEAERVLPAPDDPQWLTDARAEFEASKAAGLVAGTSTFSLYSTSVTPDIILYAQKVLRDDHAFSRM